MNKKANNPIHLRPRFTIDINENHALVLQRFQVRLKEQKVQFPSRFSDGHIIIDVPLKAAHFWSPQLNLEIVEVEEDQSILKGLFGPKPQVWTLFMFIHFVVGIAFLIFAVMLYVQWSLNGSIVFPLMMTIFLPVFWGVLYFLGRIGKSTGHSQMDDLHDLMTSIIEK